MGLGDVDWSVVHGELYRQGYQGDCIIEHEDRRFEGSDEAYHEAEAYAAQALSIPLFPSLTDAQQDRVVAALSAALQA